MTGYAHPLYAESLAEFGRPRPLQASGGWVLERPVPGSPLADLMGCYPIFACTDWSRLPEDFKGMQGQFVSLSLVADPFGRYTLDDLHHCFHRVKPFKEHYLTEIGRLTPDAISKHHRYYARRALRDLRVERCHDPPAHLDEWVCLYANLIKRHGLSGIKAFSRRAFEIQMRVPGLVMLRAVRGQETVGAHLWYVQGDVGYSHLMAVNDAGYEMSASYALYWEATLRAPEMFGPEVRRLNLGAGAGVGPDTSDGLSRFKRAWATNTCPVYFCGRVLDDEKYRALTGGQPPSATEYFPPYRKGEFK